MSRPQLYGVDWWALRDLLCSLAVAYWTGRRKGEADVGRCPEWMRAGQDSLGRAHPSSVYMAPIEVGGEPELQIPPTEYGHGRLRVVWVDGSPLSDAVQDACLFAVKLAARDTEDSPVTTAEVWMRSIGHLRGSLRAWNASPGRYIPGKGVQNRKGRTQEPMTEDLERWMAAEPAESDDLEVQELMADTLQRLSDKARADVVLLLEWRAATGLNAYSRKCPLCADRVGAALREVISALVPDPAPGTA